MKDYIFVDSHSDLKAVDSQLKNAPRFGFDLEGDFDLYHYGRRICLFQISFEAPPYYLLDPLAFDALEALHQALESPAVEKVIWGAQNDVRVLREQFHCQISNLVDLWEAARLSVHPKPSLPYLVKNFCGVDIQKSEELQTSDWNIRPLSEPQRDYAAQDVRYLLPLWDQLKLCLKEKNKERDFQNSMAHMEKLEFRVHDEPWLRLKGTGLLTQEQREILKQGYRFRDGEARRQNLAPWRLFRNEYLVDWSKAPRLWSLPPEGEPLEKSFYEFLRQNQEIES